MTRRREDWSRFSDLPTEAASARSMDLELASTEEVVRLVVDEEHAVHEAARLVVAEITRAAELVADALRAGGRLVYVGAGTSGRLGALDAAELPPTFGIARDRAVAIIAGGPRALSRSVEGAEDHGPMAVRRLQRLAIGPTDVVCGIAASGVTPFARAALEYARARGARTVFVTCNAATDVQSDVLIAPRVGPELLPGSTRLKGGSVTKLVLNAISTAAMTRLGKVYRGRMVDVVASNEKLRARALRIVMELTELDERHARALLRRAGGHCKLALAIHLTGTSTTEASRRLLAADGDLRRL
ncbi:MAG: N-acetylmuramic acid 6-phosphate etherase [Polyangia bacterium]